MASYNVQTPDGASYTVDAANEDQLNDAVNDLMKPPGKTLAGFADNTAKDFKSNLSGSEPDPREGQLNTPKQAWEDLKETVSAPIQEAKRVFNDPIQAAYDKPVTTAMDVGALFGLRGEAPITSDIEGAMKPPEVAPEVPKVGASANEIAGASTTPSNPSGAVEPQKAPTPINLPTEVQEILNKAKSSTSPAPQDNDLENFVKDKFKKVSETPLSNSTIGKYAKENANNMAMKSLGASPGQIRKIGIPQAEKLADYAFDKGIVNLKTGDIGAREKIQTLNNNSGQIVGDMRQLASQRGATHDMAQLLNTIHSKIGDEYASGVNSGEKGEYFKSLEQIAKTPNTPDAMANTVTKLFQEAKGRDRLKQPSGAFSNVARELRSANEDLIANKLSPKELNVYHNALEDYGATTQLGEFTKRKQSTEMGGRIPPGMGPMRAVFQKALDVGGYRGQAQIMNNIAKFMKENPTATTTPKDLFRKYVDEAHEAIDDIGEPQQ